MLLFKQRILLPLSFADGAAIIRVTNPDFDNAINKSCQGKITRDAAFNTQTISLIFSRLYKTGSKLKYGLQLKTSVTVKLEGTGSTEKQLKQLKQVHGKN
jgi:hypothetical protein